MEGTERILAQLGRRDEARGRGRDIRERGVRLMAVVHESRI